MRLWPFGKTQQPRQSPAEALQNWDGGFRWSGEVGPNNLKFSGDAGSLNAPEDLLRELAGLSGRRIARADALKAMAVLRARNLIAGVSATLPLELRDRDRNLDESSDWLGIQPNPKLETTVHMALTFEDLLFEGKSYWRVLKFGPGGFPLEAEHVDIRAVSQHAVLGMPSQVISEDLQFSLDDPVYIDGEAQDPRTIIRFISPNPPLLVHAAKAIRTLLLLDQIAADFATDPIPFGYFTDAEDIGEEDQLEDAEINEVLDKWAEARRRRRWGYVASGLKLEMLDAPDPSKLQLSEARDQATLEVARGAGLDPEEIGVHIQGVSRTYQNASQRRLDLIDFVLVPYMRAVEDRLSMRDVTPDGLNAAFVVHAFERADFSTRMEGYKASGEAEVLTVNERRKLEGLPDLTPAQKKELAPTPPPPPPAPSGEGEEPSSNGSEPNGSENARSSSNGR